MGREKKKVNISSKLIFTALAMICVGLIVISYLFPDILSPVRAGVGNFFAPMQQGLTVIGGGISEKLKLFSLSSVRTSTSKSLRVKLFIALLSKPQIGQHPP